MHDTFRQRFQQAVAKASRRIGGDKPLAARIADYSSHSSNMSDVTINRRTIKRITLGDDVELKLSQLMAFDGVLRSLDLPGLGALWNPPGVLDDIAQHGRLTFLMGARPDAQQRRIDLSRWDLRAHRRLLSDLYSKGAGFEVGLEDVVYRGDRSAVDFQSPAANEVTNERWYQLLYSRQGPSLLCIGSPLANHASELILAQMFGVKPFATWAHSSPRPFAFCWARGDARGDHLQSAFKISPSQYEAELTNLHGYSEELVRRLETPESMTIAVVAGDEIREVVRNPGGEWDTYGFIVACREQERVICCVMGLTGPATLGASRLLSQFAVYPPAPRANSKPKVAWVMVRVLVRDSTATDAPFLMDHRQIVDCQFEGPIRWFEPEIEQITH